jgi:prolyl-tRNA synthetase
MAGSWTLLPLGWRVITKINNIIREEMNATGAQEMLMPLMHPKEIWNETGRWEEAAAVMYRLKDSRRREFALSFTHEEIVMDLIRKHAGSYKDLPIKIYHFSTKFRNEARPTGGILRGREFLMKDLYSAHATEEDLWKYYEEVKEAYRRIFARLGLAVRITEAGGGVFTGNRTHEFQVITPAGEDTIYICDRCGWGENLEIYPGQPEDACPGCREGKVKEERSIEVGNIFPLGTKYAEKMKAYFLDRDGTRKPYWFGSYGIGPSRVLGTLAEVYHDECGLVWPEAVAPYKYHLIAVKSEEGRVKNFAEKVYKNLTGRGVEVLYDDREEVSAGEKFADADLIGCPYRLVISDKTGTKIEIKKRVESETRLLDFRVLTTGIKTI